jgi:hypothetical protein
MAFKECADCGSRIYSGHCVYCHEEFFMILEDDYEDAREPVASGRALHVAGTQGVVPSAEEQKTRPSSTPVRTRKEKP